MTVRVPKYRLHKPTALALVEIRGQRIYLGRYNSRESRAKCRRKIAELMSSDASPSVAVAAASSPASCLQLPLMINEAALRYFRHAKRYKVKNGEPTDEVVAIRYGHLEDDRNVRVPPDSLPPLLAGQRVYDP